MEDKIKSNIKLDFILSVVAKCKGCSIWTVIPVYNYS